MRGRHEAEVIVGFGVGIYVVVEMDGEERETDVCA